MREGEATKQNKTKQISSFHDSFCFYLIQLFLAHVLSVARNDHVCNCKRQINLQGIDYSMLNLDVVYQSTPQD
jgi:hypothetical protein